MILMNSFTKNEPTILDQLHFTEYLANPEYIKRVVNPSIALQILVVEHDPYAVQDIENPNEDVVIHAMHLNRWPIYHVITTDRLRRVAKALIDRDKRLKIKRFNRMRRVPRKSYVGHTNVYRHHPPKIFTRDRIKRKKIIVIKR